jgi:hypothetical protein
MIRADDLQGTYDITISAGLGTGNKQANVQNMMMLIQNIIPNLMALGLATPVNLYNACKKLVEEMGYKNYADYLGQDPAQMMQMFPGAGPMMPGQPGPMMPGTPNQPNPVPPTGPMPPAPPANPRGFK